MNTIIRIQGLSVMTWAWFVLVGMTVLAWWFGTASDSPDRVIVGVIITAAIKIWVIGYQFMELHHAPSFLHYAFVLWLIVISTVLLLLLGIV